MRSLKQLNLEAVNVSRAVVECAEERTSGLVHMVGFYDGDLKRLLAIAYLQGVVDVANNFQVGGIKDHGNG